jgi:CHASE1-domain containing sensor protein
VLSELLLAVSDTVSDEDCPKTAELGDVSPDVMEAELFNSSTSPYWRSAELLSSEKFGWRKKKFLICA